MEYLDFVSWAFYGLISFAFYRLDKIMSELKESVDKLNVTLAVEIQKMNDVKSSVESLMMQTKDHERRLQIIEVGCSMRHKKD